MRNEAVGHPTEVLPRVISPMTEREHRLNSDYTWAMQDPMVRTRYGGMVVVVHEKQVWGSGVDHGAALRLAQKQAGCPASEMFAFVVVPHEIVVESDSAE